ncbi:hypothetical protein [Maricaulis parjimensis]|uniref:hypothetical protein n=1 Tax=Maricaulis parjimensis TaxID=144023 RepID=UPI00193A4665|nr:hypothetical protein [Maricaulis parjimensis]
MDFLFHYWWLLFPLGWFIAAGWGSFMRYKRHQAKIDLLKTYTAAGREPPAELIASLDKSEDDHNEWHDTEKGSSGHASSSNAFLVILFAGLAGVFAYTGYAGLLGDIREEMYFVAMIMGVLCLAFLVGGLFRGGRRRD